MWVWSICGGGRSEKLYCIRVWIWIERSRMEKLEGVSNRRCRPTSGTSWVQDVCTISTAWVCVTSSVKGVWYHDLAAGVVWTPMTRSGSGGRFSKHVAPMWLPLISPCSTNHTQPLCLARNLALSLSEWLRCHANAMWFVWKYIANTGITFVSLNKI